MQKVAVVILNYNSWEDSLKEAEVCVNSQGVNASDIIIVDNNSPNGSFEKLRENNKGYFLIRNGINSGYAAGNNIGLRYAYEKGYDYAWILNNDIIINDARMFKKCLTIFAKDRSIAVVNPDVYSSDGYLYNRDKIRYSFFYLTIGQLRYKKIGRNIDDLGGYGIVYRPQGCCMLLDLKKMNEIDFMDENTFLYCEEMILAEKLLARNYKCACCTLTSVIHNHSKTVKGNMKAGRIIKEYQKSYSYYLKKYRKFGYIKRSFCLLFNYAKLKMLG